MLDREGLGDRGEGCQGCGFKWQDSVSISHRLVLGLSCSQLSKGLSFFSQRFLEHTERANVKVK